MNLPFVGRPSLHGSAVKGARVGEFQGKNLSTGFSSTVLYNDNSVPETAALQKWWTETGSTATAKAISSSGELTNRLVSVCQGTGRGRASGFDGARDSFFCG